MIHLALVLIRAKLNPRLDLPSPCYAVPKGCLVHSFWTSWATRTIYFGVTKYKDLRFFFQYWHSMERLLIFDSPSKQIPNDSPISPSLCVLSLKPPAASTILLCCLSTWAINGSEGLLWMTCVVPPTGTGSKIAVPSTFMGIHRGAIVLPRGHNVLDKIVNQFLALCYELQATF